MSWLSDLLHHNEPKTFEQDLELLIARWMDASRKGLATRSRGEIAAVLLDKADRLTLMKE